MRKHAYLIIAHNNFEILENLIVLLDDFRNDIYIHIDNKVKSFDFKYFERLAKKSEIKIFQKINVYWGGATQIEVELFLLEQASKGEYDYYHLLSGVDIPLKSQNCIHRFFDENRGKEFVDFDECFDNMIIEKRVKYYYFFIGGYRSSNIVYRCFSKLLNKISVKIQEIIGITKAQKNYVYKKGSAWFSITHTLAKYILKQKAIIEKNYRYSLCCDEVFIQSIVYNSYFFMRVPKIAEKHNLALRYIDWEHGNPYVFKNSDFKRLVESKALFARKFDLDNIDIVQKIVQYILK